MLVGEGGAPWLPSAGAAPTPPGANSGVPAAVGTPYTTAIPGSALYAQAALAANTAYQKALAQLNQQRTGTLRTYGYLGDIDPKTGVLKNVRVDPNNPYGEFQQLLRSSALNSESAVNDAVARGIHGGLAHQAERQVQFDHGAASAQLGQSMTDALSQLQQQQNADLEQRDAALYQAELDQARQAMDALASNGSINPADTAGLDIPAYGVNELPGATAPKRSAGSSPPKNTRYFTRAGRVPLKSGQSVHFKRGRGYYAAPKGR